ncbi:MFS transporter [Acidisoma cellulosilytica]|uniref:MFS transporter n=1 Tax=Acidisoma cellulosilyticum TaxID=2802395 RepID=A0A963Z5J7_9PROT|nr:MFS transporter [Acidisoma cellulosilyticum]MCB8883300.1 MFS transporter [Acidisoma cellulosilyticum]
MFKTQTFAHQTLALKRRQTDIRPAIAPVKVRRGTPDYQRISLALFLAGFATFSLLYTVQPLLPLFAQHFHVTPAASSLALSLSTGALACAIMLAAMLSETAGRRGLMFISMSAAAIMNIVAGLAPNWTTLLIARALEGFVLGGVPAVAMAYLAEEIDGGSLGLAMGRYVGGTAFGGMMGRVGAGLFAEAFGWRAALCIMGALGVAAAIAFVLLLPASRYFDRKRGFDLRFHVRAWGGHLTDRGLPLLFAIGFLVMGAFVTVYNYAGFRLMAAPYHFSQTVIGLIFTVYVFGIVASSTAGSAADKLGRGRVLPMGLGTALIGALLTLSAAVPVIILGIILLTVGFFISHAVASGWVGRLAAGSKGHASSLYLLAYYLGSSVAGTAGGWFWSHGGWPGVISFAGVCLVLALFCGLGVGRISRPQRAEPR